MSIKTSDGTTIRDTEKGIILTKGKRELHILGTSVEQTHKARTLASKYSFNRLYSLAKSSPIKNTRYIKLT